MENSNLDDIDRPNSDSNSETDNAATATSSIALNHDTPKKKSEAIESIPNKVGVRFRLVSSSARKYV